MCCSNVSSILIDTREGIHGELGGSAVQAGHAVKDEQMVAGFHGSVESGAAASPPLQMSKGKNT